MAEPVLERTAVLVLNAISADGLALLPAERHRICTDIAEPAAILLRSADLHGHTISASVVAVGRAGPVPTPKTSRWRHSAHAACRSSTHPAPMRA